MRRTGLVVLAAVLLVALPSPTPARRPSSTPTSSSWAAARAASAAALQSARLGARTIVAEPTPWLGGMLSAAGVSATDGNHRLPSGIWREFRQRIYAHYGGPEAVNTGWVSNTHFEPHVADRIFKEMAAAEPSLRVLFRHRFVDVVKEGGRVRGAVLEDLATGRRVEVRAKVVVDGTDLGDVLARAGAAFDLGLEADSVSGENAGIAASSDVVQDLTWCAILKDYGPGADRTIPRPAGLRPGRVRLLLDELLQGRDAREADRGRAEDARLRAAARRQVPRQLAEPRQRHVPQRGGSRRRSPREGPRGREGDDAALRLLHPARAGLPEPRPRRRRVPDEGPAALRPVPPRGPPPARRRPLHRAGHRGALRRARPALPDGHLGGGLPDRPPPQAQPDGAPAPVVRPRARRSPSRSGRSSRRRWTASSWPTRRSPSATWRTARRACSRSSC